MDDATRRSLATRPFVSRFIRPRKPSEIFIEADFETLPEGGSTLRPRQHSPPPLQRSHRSISTTCCEVPRCASITEKSRYQLIPGLARSPISHPRTLARSQEQTHLGTCCNDGSSPKLRQKGLSGTTQLGSAAYHENRLRGQASLHIDEASGTD